MNAQLKNGILIASVAALAIFPLTVIKQPAAGADGTKLELFKGSDDQASAAIQTLAPGYKPWFQSIFKAPSSEIDTLLFALQAAIGAGFIGYYVGYSRGRANKKTLNPVAAPDTEERCGNEFVSAIKMQKTNSET